MQKIKVKALAECRAKIVKHYYSVLAIVLQRCHRWCGCVPRCCCRRGQRCGCRGCQLRAVSLLRLLRRCDRSRNCPEDCRCSDDQTERARNSHGLSVQHSPMILPGDPHSYLVSGYRWPKRTRMPSRANWWRVKKSLLFSENKRHAPASVDNRECVRYAHGLLREIFFAPSTRSTGAALTHG